MRCQRLTASSTPVCAVAESLVLDGTISMQKAMQSPTSLIHRVVMVGRENGRLGEEIAVSTVHWSNTIGDNTLQVATAADSDDGGGERGGQASHVWDPGHIATRGATLGGPRMVPGKGQLSRSICHGNPRCGPSRSGADSCLIRAPGCLAPYSAWPTRLRSGRSALDGSAQTGDESGGLD